MTALPTRRPTARPAALAAAPAIAAGAPPPAVGRRARGLDEPLRRAARPPSHPDGVACPPARLAARPASQRTEGPPALVSLRRLDPGGHPCGHRLSGPPVREAPPIRAARASLAETAEVARARHRRCHGLRSPPGPRPMRPPVPAPLPPRLGPRGLRPRRAPPFGRGPRPPPSDHRAPSAPGRPGALGVLGDAEPRAGRSATAPPGLR